MRPNSAPLELKNLCEVVDSENYNNSPSRIAIAFLDTLCARVIHKDNSRGPNQNNVLREDTQVPFATGLTHTSESAAADDDRKGRGRHLLCVRKMLVSFIPSGLRLGGVFCRGTLPLPGSG